MRITCVGSGPAGLYFAILARKQGHDVNVLERLRERDIYGWGVTFPDDLMVDLRTNDPESAEQIAEAAFPWVDQIVHLQGTAPVQVDFGGQGIGRRAMRDILLARARDLGVDIRFEQPFEDQAQLPPYDLLVGCDGVNSAVRRPHARALGTAVQTGRNKYVWLGTDRVFSSFTYPFVSTPAGWIWGYGYAFSPSMSTFIVETAPATWRGLGLDRLDRDATMRCLEELFSESLEGHSLQPQAEVADDLLPWLEFRRVTNKRWHSGNVVLIGDAAHTTHYTVGSGTWLALGDAIALAHELRVHDELGDALQAYGRRRAAEIRAIQRKARNSGAWFERAPRHAERDPDRFADLLRRSSSSFLRWMPAGLYLRLIDAADRVRKR